MNTAEILSTLREAVLCYEAHSSENDGKNAIQAYEIVSQTLTDLHSFDNAPLGDTELAYEYGRECVQHEEDWIDEDDKKLLSMEQLEDLLQELVCCRKHRAEDESNWLECPNANALAQAFQRGVHDEIANALKRIQAYYQPLPCEESA